MGLGTGSGVATSTTSYASSSSSSSSSSSDTEKTIWILLKSKGFTDYAVAGIMGNLYAESGLQPNNLQNNGNSKLNLTDAQFTEKVDSGAYSEYMFVHDGYGYGLAQWTYYTLKQQLYTAAQSVGTSIADLNMQINLLYTQLSDNGLVTSLNNSKGVKEASNIMLTKFERPADQSESVQNKRASYGQTYYNKYALLTEYTYTSSGVVVSDLVDTSASLSNLNADGTLSQRTDVTNGIVIDLSDDTSVNSVLTSYIAAISGQYGVVSFEGVDYSKLTPYIATLTRYTSSVNMSRLKLMGVCGVLIEAGYLYDSAHNKVTFNSPKAAEQVKQCESADMPWGFYMTAKARSVDEASEEMYYFSFPIRKYPPVLGAWLELDLVKSETLNNMIVDRYYEELVRLGLKSKIGFYATDSQLSKITWTKYNDEWLLWLNRHVTSMADLKEQVTPAFFVVK